MTTLAEILGLLEGWYPPHTADDWDRVGLICGDPSEPVERILLAVDPVQAVAAEAVAAEADLLIVHHPLYLRGTSSVAATDPKGRVVHQLVRAGCALYAAHTNADAPPTGVSESLALALELDDVRPLEPSADDPESGSGRIGTLREPITLREFAEQVRDILPETAHGVRVAGDAEQVLTTVALCGGAGDFLLDRAREVGADVYLTSDLRHHPASELREQGGPALVDVAQWAPERNRLPVLADRLGAALASEGATVEVRVSEIVTDPWTFRL
ncbi:MAG: Nif3-like dinuclear metal center hexameric protein [Marmoricola sp.]